MDKWDANLIEKFKKLEAEIIEILKQNDIQFDESISEKSLKVKLKKYIASVKKLEKLFDEYELIAEKIGSHSKDKKENAAINEALVNLREDSVNEVSIIENVDNKPVLKRKKKANGKQLEI